MPLLTVRDGARAVVHHIEAPVALDELCPSPPPLPYAGGWFVRPEGSALALISPSGDTHGRIDPGGALALGEMTFSLEAQGAAEGRTERLLRETPLRLMLVLPCGRRVALPPRTFTLGRDRRCDLVLDDASVSALHCRLVPVRGTWEVHDAGSTNGTRVGGVRIERALLAPGTTLTLGRTRLLCIRDPADESASPVAVGAATVLVGDSPAMETVRQAIARFAPRPYPVLVQGETGAGKELVARMLHERSSRARGPFVALNAATIAPELVESELFGHERGAFTGAAARRRGVFEEAQGGTLFLDEIGELPLAQQAKLLRVLETGEVRRVGAEGSVRVDARVVAATHRDLAALAREGLFRTDLLYRLDVLRVRLPPLRERREDLPALARHLMARIAAEIGVPKVLEDAALAVLCAHDWPGNVRELYGVLRRAAVEAEGERVGTEHLSRAHAEAPTLPSTPAPPRTSGVFEQERPSESRARDLGPAELRALLEAFGGNKSRAAAAVGIARSTFRDRLARGR